MNKLTALWALFRQGEAVANPAAWKAGQVTSTALAGLVLAIVHVAGSFGYALPIDQGTADAIGAGVLALANVVLTLVSNHDVGFKAAATAAPGDTAGKGDAPSRAPETGVRPDDTADQGVFGPERGGG